MGVQTIMRYPDWNGLRGLCHPSQLPMVRIDVVMERAAIEIIFSLTGKGIGDPLHQSQRPTVLRCSLKYN